MRRFLGLIGAATAGLALIFWLWPVPKELLGETPATLRFLDVRGNEIATVASPEARAQIPVPLEKMGAWLPRVTVALEDQRFYSHHGVDFRAIAGALLCNLQHGRILSGASTIDQQLVKLATARRGRNWSAKIRETIVARKIAQRWPRSRILAEYLNRSSFGNRRLGPEAASQAYFGKSAGDLTLAESIYLAGLPQAPTRLNPWTHPERAAKQYQQSLARLRARGAIDQTQFSLFAKAPPEVQHHAPADFAPHFVQALRAAHPKLCGTVTTTLDLELQARVEKILRAHLANLNRYDIEQAAVVILENQSGAVRAMIGSSNFSSAENNGALEPRSSGSTLKPFVYLQALDQHLLTAASILPDTADAIRDIYRDYDPQNYSHRFFGPVRLREALACSLNVPAVVTLSRLGARSAFYDMQKWGFVFPSALDTYGAGFVLGNAEVRLIDLASAYAGLARGGRSGNATFLAGEHPARARLASAEACAIITDILSDNQARARTFGLTSPLAFSERVAAKTGTSSGFRDAWTIGFDREHTVGVWAGNFSGASMRDTSSVQAAAPLWAALMHDLLQRDHALPPPELSPALSRHEICRATGLLPSARNPATISELFLAGTEPSVSSADHFDEAGHLVLGSEYARWCASNDNVAGAQVKRVAQITNPAPGSHFQIDRDLAPRQQMIEFISTLGRDAKWFVNDQPQLPQPDGRTFWQVEPGAWNVRVVDRDGDAETKISVE